jgi:hypothetical protein
MTATLLLDRSNWDLCLDAAGNIAVASEPYSQAQDIASECRVFAGECYYDTTRGLPFKDQVLGQYQPAQVLKAALVDAALKVPGVTDATVYLSGITGREISGQVQFNGGIATL